jgi:hypothetical protein
MNMDDAEFKRALATPSFPHPLESLGAAAAVLPFFLHYTTSSTRSVNGAVVEAVTRNWVAIGGGALALLAGAFSLAMARSTPDETRGKRRLAGLALVAAGFFQLVIRGGLLG